MPNGRRPRPKVDIYAPAFSVLDCIYNSSGTSYTNKTSKVHKVLIKLSKSRPWFFKTNFHLNFQFNRNCQTYYKVTTRKGISNLKLT